MTQAAKLRELMRRPGIIKTVGAHDALSAKLIEEAGFDAIWASGFGISASLKCIPDGSFLTMTEQLEVTKNIVEAVRIPVIADCDTGFGNALNVMRTIFGAVTAEELERHGFKFVIFANQVIRTAIKAMHDTLDVLKRENRAEAVSDRMVTLQEVYDLVGVTKMEEDERKFLPVGTEKITAIIPAAGFEKQLLPLIQDKPKCLLDIKGKTILERQIAALNEVNIKDIAVVRGYQKEKIAFPNLRYYDNDRYEDTGELTSIF